MKIAIPSPAHRLGKIFQKYGIQLYLVGGYVRNKVMGLPGSDMDVCSSCTPEQLDEICKKEHLHHFKKGKFGTIEVRLRIGPEVYGFEHTTFRSDVYKEGGHHRPVSVKFTDNILYDARRRDFTANALYADVLTGDVIDPTGRGVTDIKDRVLRACMPNPWDTMDDDAHRILRMVRIASEFGFQIEDVTYKAAKYNARYLINIAYERVRDEFLKTITADGKYGVTNGAERGIKLLDSLCVLEYIVPSVARSKGVPLPEGYGCDLYTHLVKTALACPPDPLLRVAALYHDVGRRAFSASERYAKGHEKVAVQDTNVELSRLRFSAAQINRVNTLITQHMFDADCTRTPAQIRKKMMSLTPEVFDSLTQLRRADTNSRAAASPDVAARWQAVADEVRQSGIALTVSELSITGDDIMKQFPNVGKRRIGELLKRVLAACLDDPSVSTREAQLAVVAGAIKQPPQQMGAGGGGKHRRRRRRKPHTEQNPL